MFKNPIWCECETTLFKTRVIPECLFKVSTQNNAQIVHSTMLKHPLPTFWLVPNDLFGALNALNAMGGMSL